MSSKSQSSPWPQYPDIPIYFDAKNEHGTPVSNRTTEQPPSATEVIPPTPSFRYFTVAPSALPTNFSLKVPNAETKPMSTPRHARRPPLRYFLDNKSSRISKSGIRRAPSPGHSVRFDSPPATKEQGPVRSYPGSKSSLGLGIIDTPPYQTFITSDTSPLSEKSTDRQNLAQRFERRIWEYNSSGNVVKRWILEIISWLVSAACMAAIIGVLINLKDERLPKWPFGLTLNAYIAVLSKVAGAALLLPTSEALGQLKWSWFQGDSKKMWDFEIFDNASRGPWGSILLLIRTKGRTLAALGAAITVLSLALDPFFQQVVDFPERWMSEGWNSSIPKVTRYEPHSSVVLAEGKRQSQFDSDVRNVVEKFFYGNGTQPIPLGNGTRAEIPLSCPTSNCTWPVYQTLGVCSACTDVSQLLTFGCRSSITIDWIANLTGAGTESTYPKGTVCGYFINATSENPVLMSGYTVDSLGSPGEILLTRSLPLVTNPARELLFGGSINFRDIRNPITDVIIVTASEGPVSVTRNNTPLAQECVMSWCVKTMESSYYWANYQERVIAEFKNTTAGAPPLLNKPRIGSSYAENVTINLSSNNSKGSVYGLSDRSAFQTIIIFDDIFPSFTTAKSTYGERLLRTRNYLPVPVLRIDEYNPWLAPNNLTRHMERLAVAMTNAVRSSPSKEMILGMAFNKENYVSVRWIWLTLPLSLLLLTLVFLVSTVLKASRERNRVGVWKTSAIATLLYGLPDEMQRKITSSTLVGTPRTKAKDLRVRLSKGWRVSGNLFSPLTPKLKPNRPPPGWI